MFKQLTSCSWHLKLVCLSWLVLPVNSFATTDQLVLTFEDAVEKTLIQNPALHQFKLSSERLMAERDTHSLKPGFEIGAELENIAGSGNRQGIDNAELTIALSSVIELGHKRQARISLSDAGIHQSDYERQAQTLDVLGTMTQAFIAVLSTQVELDLTTESVSLSEALYNTAHKRAQRGAGSDAQLMRAKAQVSQAKIQQESLQAKLERQKVSLARFWGTTTIEFPRVAGDLFAFSQPEPFEKLYKRVKQSPAMTFFSSDERLKDAQIALAKTRNYADVTWQVGVRRFEDTDDAALTFGFSMPLNTANRNNGQVKAAMLSRDILTYQRQEQLILLHEQLFNAYSQLQQFIQTHKQLQQNVIPDLEQALRITQDAYNRGRLPFQDRIIAQQELLSAKKQLIETASAALINQAIIEQLTAEPLDNSF